MIQAVACVSFVCVSVVCDARIVAKWYVVRGLRKYRWIER